jgi:hypothetical protein
MPTSLAGTPYMPNRAEFTVRDQFSNC